MLPSLSLEIQNLTNRRNNTYSHRYHYHDTQKAINLQNMVYQFCARHSRLWALYRHSFIP